MPIYHIGMLRIACAVALLVTGFAGAQPAVPVAEPESVALWFTTVTSDGGRFYAFGTASVRGRGFARVLPDGTILDRDVIPMPYSVHVGATGAGVHVLLASDWRASYLIGLSPDGTILWKTELPQDSASESSSLVFDGAGFLVVHQTENALRMTRVDPAGMLLGTRVLPGGGRGMRAVAVGDRLFIAWFHFSKIEYVLMRPDDDLPARVAIDLPRSFLRSITVASNGRGVLLTWTAGPSPSQKHSVHALALGPFPYGGGFRTAAGPITISDDIADEYYDPMRHASAWDGAMWRVAWSSRDGNHLNVADLSPGLSVRGRAALATAGGVPAIAVAGSRVLVASARRGVFVDAGASIAPDASLQPLLLDRPESRTPAVAWTGDRYVVAWVRFVGDLDGVRARFFDAAGSPLGNSFVVTHDRVATVKIAASRDAVLVMWRRYLSGAVDFLGRRFALDGTPLDAEPFMLPRNTGDVNVASTGDEFLIVESYGCHLRLRTLTARSPFVESAYTEIASCNAAEPRFEGLRGIEAVWDGAEYGVLYHEQLRSMCRCGGIPDFVPYVIRVSRGGSATPSLRVAGPDPFAFGYMAAADGQYVLTSHRWGTQRGRLTMFVPYDLSTARPIAEKVPNIGPIVWTGREILTLFGEGGYDVRNRDWQLMRRVALPAFGEFSRPSSAVAGAGNGFGGALIVSFADDRDHTLMATTFVLHTKRRSARAE